MITQLFCLTAISYLLWHTLFIKKLVPFKNFLNALPIVSTHIKNSDSKYTTRLEHTAKSIAYHFIKHAGMTAQRSHAITNCTWTLFRTLFKNKEFTVTVQLWQPMGISLWGLHQHPHRHQDSSTTSPKYFLIFIFKHQLFSNTTIYLCIPPGVGQCLEGKRKGYFLSTALHFAS